MKNTRLKIAFTRKPAEETDRKWSGEIWESDQGLRHVFIWSQSDSDGSTSVDQDQAFLSEALFY